MKTLILKGLLLILVLTVVLSIKTALASSQEVSEHIISVEEEVEVINTSDLSTEEYIKYIFGEYGDVAYAVMMSESRGNIHAKNNNSDRVQSQDRGLWQINSYWHSDISDECAYDRVCATAYAFELSDGGKDFSPWYGYTDNKHLAFLKTS